MNKQGICPDFHNEPLQVVKQYKYLGLLITSSGSFIKYVENMSQRAMKADIKTKSTLHLFDTLVRPIATYVVRCGVPIPQRLVFFLMIQSWMALTV